ncbi:MAG: outer membrane protein assembly factor BamB [Magnetococcales bacterium]|nr:outer membrane protein assembly factor BamB [Magnetococcales bacterium]
MTVNVRLPIILLSMVLLLSGCSSIKNMWADEEEEAISGFKELKPGRSVGLKKLWSSGISGKPDDYMAHPRVFAVDSDGLYVGTYDGDVVRVGRTDGKVRWRAELETTIVGGVAVDAERVYAGTAEGELVALSRQDGSVLWRSLVSTTIASAPLVVADRVIFTTLNNRTYALDVTNGERLWTHSSVPVALVMKGAATPSSDGRIVYIGYSTGEVFALNVSDGAVKWGENISQLSGRTELDRLQDVDAEIVLDESSGRSNRLPMVYTVNHQGAVMALHPANGAHIWKHKLSAIRRPLLWNNRLLISDVNGNLVSLNADDGKQLWSINISDGTLSAPVIFGGRILVGDDKGRLITLDPTSGRVYGLDKLGDPILSDPLVQDRILYIWTNDGDLISYGMEGP